MKNRFFKNILKNKWLLVTAVIDTLLILSVFFLMDYVQYLLNEDVRINLTEIVTQNKDVISSKLAVEFNNLDLDAQQLSDQFSKEQTITDEDMTQAFLRYANERQKQGLVWATINGEGITQSGERLDVSGRAYFQAAIRGTVSISDRLVSRFNGEDTFVLCAPVFLRGQVIGTLQRQYSPQTMYDLCSVSLFSEQGSTYIINNEGYILLCSQQSEYSRESDNYFRIIYLTDPDAAKRLESDIRSAQSGFMEATIDGTRVFFAYTPVEKIDNWYLISSIATAAVSPNANVVVRLFYCVLLAVALLFTLSIFLYWSIKRRQQKNLERIAFVDEVTGGHSYTKFTVDLQQILKQYSDHTFYICAFDIDNFKYINSVYSFETGDRILQKLSQLYTQKLKPNERIAHVASDQFVMLLEDASDTRLAQMAELELSIENIKIYLSMGLYCITNPEESVNLMIDKASTAAQKTKGKHFKRVELYSEKLDAETAHNEQTKRAVEQALENHEIIPFFQPKVDINTRALVGAEALARWRTADGKLIAPFEFIPLCEQTGLITLVDKAIFRQTLQFMRQKMDEGVKCVPISVNFSRAHLIDDTFLSGLLQCMEEYKIPPELIELELTETVIFDNHETINSFIRQMHSYGLKISMDDFGSGFSSLHMLKDVEIDIIKIDRGFLLDTTDNERQRTIFGSIVEMAHKLNIKVVVEGVETIENVNLMKEFNCAYAQGYYYAKPMDADCFGDIYRKGSVE